MARDERKNEGKKGFTGWAAEDDQSLGDNAIALPDFFIISYFLKEI